MMPRDNLSQDGALQWLRNDEVEVMAGLFTAVPGGLNLRRLLVLKNIAITGQTLAVIVVAHGLGMPLPVTEIISALVLLNLASWLRLRMEWPVKETELLIHLLVDVLALTLLLYFAGGATNPFVLLYLLPLTIAAATLPLILHGRHSDSDSGLLQRVDVCLYPVAPLSHHLHRDV